MISELSTGLALYWELVTDPYAHTIDCIYMEVSATSEFTVNTGILWIANWPSCGRNPLKL